MAGIFDSSGRQWMNTPSSGQQVGVGFSYNQYPWLSDINPDQRDFAMQLARMGSYEDPATKAARQASEYAAYMSALRNMQKTGAPGGDYLSQFAMSPQDWMAAEAVKKAPKTIKIEGSKKTSIKSEAADPFVMVSRPVSGGGTVMKRIRLSEKLSGDILSGKQSEMVAAEATRANLQRFQDLVSNDPEVQKNPEIAGQLQKGIDAVNKGMTAENALDLVKGIGKTPESKMIRQQTLEAKRQEYRINLAKVQSSLREDLLQKSFENSQTLQDSKQLYDQAKTSFLAAQKAITEAARNNQRNTQEEQRLAQSKSKMDMELEKMKQAAIEDSGRMVMQRQALAGEINRLKRASAGITRDKDPMAYDDYQNRISDLQRDLSIIDNGLRIKQEFIDRGQPATVAPEQTNVEQTRGSGNTLPPGYVRVKLSDGSVLDIQKSQLDASIAWANEKGLSLKVIEGQ